MSGAPDEALPNRMAAVPPVALPNALVRARGETAPARRAAAAPLVLGTMQFGEALGREEAFAMLDRAVAAGVGAVDTAEMYPVPQRAATPFSQNSPFFFISLFI